MDVINVDYDGMIPNNVGLNQDTRVRTALEKWHPGYLDWWQDMGPEGFQQSLVYLRTAVSVDPKGWAKFDYVRMPEYKWGILLAPQVEDRKVPFGANRGEKAWQEIPGEHRAMLRRLIVIQGDTEPASVEQQRYLGKTAPSLYDMRNLFQVNVEEGRHLWAMVYLLQKYFGSDGRDEAEALLQRRSGDPDTPRMLGAFNEQTPDWLSFFMFTFFTDRDGKMQLEALAQSGFDPLSRTCRFMLTEEAHHMFVGETGVTRIVERTCEAMKEAGIEDPYDVAAVRKLGRDRPADHPEEGEPAFHAEPRPVRQRDLDQRRQRLPRRPQGTLPRGAAQRRSQAGKRHLSGAAAGRRQDREAGRAGALRAQHAAARRLRDRLQRRRRPLEQGHREIRHPVPDHAAARRVPSPYRRVSPASRRTRTASLLGEADWEKRKGEFLPSDADRDFIESLMQPQYERGKFAAGSPRPRSASTTSRATSST